MIKAFLSLTNRLDPEMCIKGQQFRTEVYNCSAFLSCNADGKTGHNRRVLAASLRIW